MIASEVPMQSCIRTSSGTPARRNASYSTGTMTAPPPMPNNPASNPVTTPAAIVAAASSTSSVTGIPNIKLLNSRARARPGHPRLPSHDHSGSKWWMAGPSPTKGRLLCGTVLDRRGRAARVAASPSAAQIGERRHGRRRNRAPRTDPGGADEPARAAECAEPRDAQQARRDLDRIPPRQRARSRDLHRNRSWLLRRRRYEGVAGGGSAWRQAARPRGSVHDRCPRKAGHRRGQRLCHGRRLHAGRAHRSAGCRQGRGLRGLGGEALAPWRLQSRAYRQSAVSDRDGDGARFPLHRRAVLRNRFPEPADRARRADPDRNGDGGAFAYPAAGFAGQHRAYDAADAPNPVATAAEARHGFARARRQDRPDRVARRLCRKTPAELQGLERSEGPLPLADAGYLNRRPRRPRPGRPAPRNNGSKFAFTAFNRRPKNHARDPVKTLLTAIAAVIVTTLLWSQPAEARCWSNGYRWHCSHHRHHYWRAGYYPYYGYRPYYRAAYYRPYAYYRPLYCVPFTPFCG